MSKVERCTGKHDWTYLFCNGVPEKVWCDDCKIPSMTITEAALYINELSQQLAELKEACAKAAMRWSDDQRGCDQCGWQCEYLMEFREAYGATVQQQGEGE